jgi:hypothetical protein
MSEFSDRLDSIRDKRDRTYAVTPVETRDSLPQLHKDCYWLLGVVEMYLADTLKDIEIREHVSKVTMERVMKR